MARRIITLDHQELPIQNIFCIGRNYAKHIEELNNETPVEPLVFLKPTSALAQADDTITLPEFSNSVHYEAELVLYIDQDARNLAPSEALSVVGGYAIGLDLTARDLQDQIKSKGEPWTKCKGFPGAAIVSDFISADKIDNAEDISFTFTQNGVLKQNGNTSMMLYPIAEIVSYLSQVYGLSEGDLIYTGTPEGVGELSTGDALKLTLEDLIDADFKID